MIVADGFVTNLIGRQGRFRPVSQGILPPYALEPGEVVVVRICNAGACEYLSVTLLYESGTLKEYPIDHIEIAAKDESWSSGKAKP